MKRFSELLRRPYCLLLFTGLVLVPLMAQEGTPPLPQKAEPPKSQDAPPPPAGGSRADVWRHLEPEQRQKLREAMRQSWTDPAVINAREEVKQAGEAFQEAVKHAVERIDPSLVKLLQRVQGAEGPWPGREPENEEKSRGRGSGLSRGFGDQIRPPGFLESLSPEEREKFRKAEEAALASEAVKAVREELDKIREEDEAIRRRRLEAHRKLRQVTLEEMVRIDPSIADLPKRLGGGPGKGQGRPPGGRKGGEAERPGPVEGRPDRPKQPAP